MKTAALSVTFPSATIALGKGMLAFLGVFWVLLLVLTTGQPDAVASGGLGSLLACACAALAMIAIHHTNVLTEALRVFGTQRAPDALWRAWARSTLLSVSRYWAVVSAGMAAQFMMPASSTSWVVAPALLSLLLCAVMLRTMGSNGLAARGWTWAFDACMVVLALYGAAGPGPGDMAQWFTSLPAPLLVACALAWPAMAWHLHQRWKAAQPVCRVPSRKPRTWSDGMIAGLFKRYTILRWDQTTARAPQKLGAKALGGLAQWFNFEFMFYFVIVQMIPMQWGGTASPVRALGLYLICTLTASRLAVRDLQWRSLLLPGGLRRNRLGQHIIRSTLTLQLLGVAGAVLGYAAFQLAIGTAPPLVWDKLSGAAILPFELVFITSAAVALRAGSARQFVGAAATVCVAIAAAVLFFLRVSWTIGVPYMTLLLLASAVLTLVSNRLWTVEKLFREIH